MGSNPISGSFATESCPRTLPRRVAKRVGGGGRRLGESRRMRALRAIALASALVVLPAGDAIAQVSVDPTVSPEINTGGWVYGMAVLLGVIGLLVIILLVAGYVRFAPRFATDESTLRVVRADRVRPGEELPRRTVDIKAAVPVVVAPPPLPQPAGVAAAAVAAPAPATAAAPAPAAPAPAAPAARRPPLPRRRPPRQRRMARPMPRRHQPRQPPQRLRQRLRPRTPRSLSIRRSSTRP